MTKSVETVSDVDRFGAVASRLVSSVVRYAEEAAVKLGGKERTDVEATLRQAKAIGELTILMSTAKVKEMLANLSPEATVSEPEPAPTTFSHEPAMESPLPDYDSLTAAQIVALMADLTADERAIVVAYEEQHRRRSSILNAADR